MKKHLLTILLFSIVIFAQANSGFLGITIKNYTDNTIKAVQITEAIKNGAGQLQGLKDNDIITHINGVKVDSKENLVATVATYKVGETIKVDFIRNNKKETLKIKLGDKPEFKDYKVQIKKTNEAEIWNFTNDNSSISLKNDAPVLYNFTDVNGKTFQVDLQKTNKNIIPSEFNDIKEKLSVINSLKKSQASCNCNCSFYQHRYYNFPEPISPTTAVQVAPKAEVTLITEKFSVFPNPTNAEFVVEFATKETGTAQISILDVTGRVVTTQHIQNYEGFYTNKFNLKDEARGTYIVQIKVGEKLATSKILLY